MKLDEYVKAATARVETIRVRTAVNPLLWLVGLVTPVSLAAAVLSDDPTVRIVCLALAAAPVLVAVVAIFLFMFYDPDRLQSEEYRLRQRALQMIYRKGANAEVVDATK
ncbi:MAG: hypothetical protein KGI57_00005, partial [Hyphomicrobiales bacterium]|nr:hypothetical protein [Hyphomicrobiales bacterium]